MNRSQKADSPIVVITGATSGIGLATATVLASNGAFVLGVGRSEERCRAAEEKVRGEYPHAKIQYLIADLSSMKQVGILAGDIQTTLKERGCHHLDVLVNNAGAFSNWYVSTAEGFELQFAVNHLAPFLLTLRLIPLLKNAREGKVITVSSGSHYGARIHWKDVMLRKHYNCLRAYKQSKLCNVLFTKEINRRLGSDASIRAYAVDPGLVNTDIGFKGTAGMVKWIWKERRKKGTAPEVPAETIVHLIKNKKNSQELYDYWKNCRPKPPSRYSQKEDEAHRLWMLSEKLCGVKWEEPENK